MCLHCHISSAHRVADAPALLPVPTKGVAMNAYIVSFLVLGAVFGLASFPIRHFFSEGPHKAEDADHPHTLGSRVFWAMVCTFLWPMMILTGINSALIIARRKRQQRLIDA
jgi:hypothetical protein